MNMSREDMLRELELLPVWKLNKAESAVPPQLTAQIAVTAEAASEKHEESAETLAAKTQIEVQATALETKVQFEPARQKIAVNWLLYCPMQIPAEQHSDTMTLLNNMIHAMQLLSTDYRLVHDAHALSEYRPQQLLLFGLEAANHFKLQIHSIEQLDDQPIRVGDSVCWVIDHPAELLLMPARKRHAWQIMCAAKAHFNALAATKLNPL